MKRGIKLQERGVSVFIYFFIYFWAHVKRKKSCAAQTELPVVNRKKHIVISFSVAAHYSRHYYANIPLSKVNDKQRP